MNCQVESCERDACSPAALLCRICEHRARRHLDPAYRLYHARVVRRRRARRRGVPELLLPPLPESRTGLALTQAQLLVAARSSWRTSA